MEPSSLEPPAAEQANDGSRDQSALTALEPVIEENSTSTGYLRSLSSLVDPEAFASKHATLIVGVVVTAFAVLRVLAVSRFAPETALAILTQSSTPNIIAGTLIVAYSAFLTLGPQLPLWVALEPEYSARTRLTAAFLVLASVALAAVSIEVTSFVAMLIALALIFILVRLSSSARLHDWLEAKRREAISGYETEVADRLAQLQAKADEVDQFVAAASPDMPELRHAISRYHASSSDSDRRQQEEILVKLQRNLEAKKVEARRQAVLAREIALESELLANDAARRAVLTQRKLVRLRGLDVRRYLYPPVSVALIVVELIIFSILAPVWMPIEHFDLAREDDVNGYVVDETTAELVVLESDSRRIIRLQRDEVLTRALCSDQDRTGPLIRAWSRPKYPEC